MYKLKNMDKKTMEALKLIVDAARRTKDGYVMCVELPIKNSDERKTICDELESCGYISKVEPFGRKYIRCQVEQAAYEAVE